MRPIMEPDNVRFRIAFGFTAEVDGTTKADLHISGLFRQHWLF